MLRPSGSPERPARALGLSGVVAIAAALLLLGLIALASVWQASRNTEALRQAQASRRQSNTVAAILLAVQEGETSQRGYLLTSDPDYLQPLVHAEATLPGLLATLAADRPGDTSIPGLRQLVGKKLAELRRTISLAQSGDTAGALALVKTNIGRDDMVAIGRAVEMLQKAVDVDLQRRVTTVRQGGQLLIAIDIAGLVMVLALVGLVTLGLRVYVTTLRNAQRDTAAANAKLASSNEQLDETVRVRTADLTAAVDEIQRFAYIVSHDLRSPLVNIMGFTSELEQAAGLLARHEAILEGRPDLREAVQVDIPEALGFIKSSTGKMDRLINAILKLSREGRRVLASERLDMSELLQSVTESMRHQSTALQAVIEIADVPNIVADRLAVDQIFTNVIDNALKYLKPGRPGRIAVQGRAEGDVVCYDVADNGRGIAERDYERVFELFRRAGDQSVAGEGIGLAHVRALVRRLGGQIECRSVLDHGTAFTIRLPAVASNAVTEAA